jgi:hypothetical protein
MTRLSVSILKLAVILFVVAILIAEVLVYTPALNPEPPLRTTLKVSGPVVSVSDQIKSSYAMNVSQALYLVSAGQEIQHLYYYYDAAYPSSWSSPADWFGLSQHLQSAASQRNLGASVTTVNATQLADLVSTPPVVSTALIFASGVLPDSVFSKTMNTLAPWIRAGGLVVWVGDTIGYYSGVPNQPLVYPSPLNPGLNGTTQFLNLSLLGGSAEYFGNASQVSTGFGLNYPYSLHRDGVSLARLTATDGIALGPTALGYTNIASLTLGLGHVVYFATPVSNDYQLSLVIWNMLESYVANNAFEFAVQFNIEVSAGEDSTLNFQYPLPVNLLGASALACSFAYDTGPVGVFADSACTPLRS